MGRFIPPAERLDHHHTDHSAEILLMREAVRNTVATYPDVNTAPTHIRLAAVICEAGAALLEVHDDTGISLDDWTGPKEVVIEALFLIGKTRDDFAPNGV